jgi:hypothetical protein
MIGGEKVRNGLAKDPLAWGMGPLWQLTRYPISSLSRAPHSYGGLIDRDCTPQFQIIR